MKSIRSTLFSFSIALITILLVPLLIFLIIHFQVVAEYRQTVDKIILEQELPQVTGDMILKYYYFVLDINNTEQEAQYIQSVSHVENVTAMLNKEITDEKSLLQYQGIKNLVDNIKVQLKNGVNEAKQGNIIHISEIYEQSNHDNTFVKETTANLLATELTAVKNYQAQLQKTYIVILSLGFLILVTVIVGSLTFSWLFSKQIVTPLTELSLFSQKISEGNLDLNLNEELLDRNDETGILAHSFQAMMTTLKKKIKELEESEKSAKTANEELQKINAFTIGREVRMTELKKQIEDLESKMPPKV